MTGFAIIVEFRLQPGTRPEFLRLIAKNACASAQTEPGCRRFDVLEPDDQPDSVWLYEIYNDEAAFEAHMRSAHFAEFDAKSASLVVGKSVIRCTLACEGGAAAS
jgi:(4S)-4-hydroxy-5-phosphonooxypentane-2,3-dione isomerase